MIITHVDPQDKRPSNQAIDFSFYQKPPNHLIVCLLCCGAKNIRKTPNTLRPFCGLRRTRHLRKKSQNRNANIRHCNRHNIRQCNIDLWHFPQLKTGNRFRPAMYRCGRLFLLSRFSDLLLPPLYRSSIVDLFSRLLALGSFPDISLATFLKMAKVWPTGWRFFQAVLRPGSSPH